MQPSIKPRVLGHTALARLVLLALFLLAPDAFGQAGQAEQITVTTTLSRSSVYVGDELSYQIVVEGSTSAQSPVIEFPDTVRAQFNGPRSQSFTSQRIVNGVRRSVTERNYIFQYTLTALSEGEISIPAPSVTVNGQTYLGQPASFEALLPTLSDADDMKILAERTEVYLNETMKVECVWWIADQTSEFNFSASTFPESFVIRPVETSSSGQYQVDFVLNGQNMVGTVVTEMHNGKQMSRFTFTLTITPSELGTFELGPLRAIFTRHSGTGSRFRAYVESEPVAIRVLPVPQDGQPDNYTDAIGRFELNARASNTRVNVGDPIQLTLRIRGEEPMLGANNAPDLELDPEFAGAFKIDSDGWREITPRNRGSRSFELTLRALDERVTMIPSVKLPSFNPELGSYKVYRSEPIPLEVAAVEEITLADAVIRGAEPLSTSPAGNRVDRIELTPAAPGLWAHATGETIRNHDGFDLGQTLRNPVWQTAILAPPLLYLGSLGLTAYARKRDEELHHLKRAYRRANRLQGEASLRSYLSDVLNIDLAAVTARDAFGLPIDLQLQNECYGALLMHEHEGTTAEHGETNDLLRRIHRQCIKHHEEATT